MSSRNVKVSDSLLQFRCCVCVCVAPCNVCVPLDSAAPSWESSGWSKQREEISEHLHHGGLHQDSVSRRFTFDEKSALLRWSNLQPTRWTPQAAADAPPHTPCPGHYQLTILGKSKVPQSCFPSFHLLRITLKMFSVFITGTTN